MTLEEAIRVSSLWEVGYHGDTCFDCADNFAIQASIDFPEFVFIAINSETGIRIDVEEKPK